MFLTFYYLNITNNGNVFLILTGSGLGSKYLTFLDLGLQTNIISNVDDSTIAVELPSTFYVGAYTFHSLHVRISHYLIQYILY